MATPGTATWPLTASHGTEIVFCSRGLKSRRGPYDPGSVLAPSRGRRGCWTSLLYFTAVQRPTLHQSTDLTFLGRPGRSLGSARPTPTQRCLRRPDEPLRWFRFGASVMPSGRSKTPQQRAAEHGIALALPSDRRCVERMSALRRSPGWRHRTPLVAARHDVRDGQTGTFSWLPELGARDQTWSWIGYTSDRTQLVAEEAGTRGK